jgi:beta-galactosidase GanA
MKTTKPTDSPSAYLPAPNLPTKDFSAEEVFYVGVNVEQLSWRMRLWETYTPGRYDPQLMRDFLDNFQFNSARYIIGARHVAMEGYLENLSEAVQMAEERGIYVILALWPTEIYEGTDERVNYVQYDPYFDEVNFLQYMESVRTLAKMASQHKNVLYIDLRNEINGHIGSAYNEEWDSQQEPWGYVPDRAAGSMQKWLENKYKTISNLNSVWGGKFTSFEDIPVFHHYSIDIQGEFLHPQIVSKDMQDWLIWCLRDWVVQLRDIIKEVDPDIKVAQSTTNDSVYSSYPFWAINTREIFRQVEIGDLTDVLDFHAYADNYRPSLIELREKYPDKLIVAGEFQGDIVDKFRDYKLYADGLLFWASACPQEYSPASCTHRWDNWALTSSGFEMYKLWKGE